MKSDFKSNMFDHVGFKKSMKNDVSAHTNVHVNIQIHKSKSKLYNLIYSSYMKVWKDRDEVNILDGVHCHS